MCCLGVGCFCDVEYDQQVLTLQTPLRGILPEEKSGLAVANEDEWGYMGVYAK
jgi:hypothetical protein